MLADQSVSNTEVMQDIPDLAIALEANSFYSWFCMGSCAGDLNADIDYTFTIPSGGDGQWDNSFADGNNATDYGVQEPISLNGTQERTVTGWGYIITGSTSGNFQPQFAQFLQTDPGIVTFEKGTSVMLWKVGTD